MSERIEHCLFCNQATGKAGPGDGSLYAGTIGPFCENCYDETGLEQERAGNAEKDERIRLLEDVRQAAERVAEYGVGENSWLKLDAALAAATPAPKEGGPA